MVTAASDQIDQFVKMVGTVPGPAFPDDQHAPTKAMSFFYLSGITFDILREFFQPALAA